MKRRYLPNLNQYRYTMIIVYLLKKLSLNFLTKIWEVQIMATNTTAVSLLDCLTHNNLITNLYSTLANNRLERLI